MIIITSILVTWKVGHSEFPSTKCNVNSVLQRENSARIAKVLDKEIYLNLTDYAEELDSMIKDIDTATEVIKKLKKDVDDGKFNKSPEIKAKVNYADTEVIVLKTKQLPKDARKACSDLKAKPSYQIYGGHQPDRIVDTLQKIKKEDVGEIYADFIGDGYSFISRNGEWLVNAHNILKTEAERVKFQQQLTTIELAPNNENLYLVNEVTPGSKYHVACERNRISKAFEEPKEYATAKNLEQLTIILDELKKNAKSHKEISESGTQVLSSDSINSDQIIVLDVNRDLKILAETVTSLTGYYSYLNANFEIFSVMEEIETANKALLENFNTPEESEVKGYFLKLEKINNLHVALKIDASYTMLEDFYFQPNTKSDNQISKGIAKIHIISKDEQMATYRVLATSSKAQLIRNQYVTFTTNDTEFVSTTNPFDDLVCLNQQKSICYEEQFVISHADKTCANYLTAINNSEMPEACHPLEFEWTYGARLEANDQNCEGKNGFIVTATPDKYVQVFCENNMVGSLEIPTDEITYVFTNCNIKDGTDTLIEANTEGTQDKPDNLVEDPEEDLEEQQNAITISSTSTLSVSTLIALIYVLVRHCQGLPLCCRCCDSDCCECYGGCCCCGEEGCNGGCGSNDPENNANIITYKDVPLSRQDVKTFLRNELNQAPKRGKRNIHRVSRANSRRNSQHSEEESFELEGSAPREEE